MHREQRLIQLISECLEEKRCLVGVDATSMHQHATGLIDDNECIILKANSEWHLGVGHNGVSLCSDRFMVHGVQLALQVYPCLVLRDCFLMYSQCPSL